MGFAYVEPMKPEPAALKTVNNVHVWTDPTRPRRCVSLRNKDGQEIACVKDVHAIFVGE